MTGATVLRPAFAAHGLALLTATLAAACADSGDSRPNIVLLISDDQDYEHLGFMGSELVHTPTLDRLAEEGAVFPTAQVTAPRCRPSLASLLSGLWPHQHGIFYNEGVGRLDPRDSLPNLLRDAGYATYLGGKFWEEDPVAMGFEESDVGESFAREEQDGLFAFIEANAGRRPLFLWWSPKLPHWPHEPPERFLAQVDPERIQVPPWVRNADGFRDAERRFLAMDAWLDDCVRQLVDELRSRNLERNTLFVFLIDNGSANGYLSKGSPFEMGVRTPIVISWPGRIPEERYPDALVSSVDLYPTLLDYAGVAVPERAVGRSLRPILEGRAQADREALYGAVYPRAARPGAAEPRQNVFALHARDDRWKYVLYLERLTPAKNEIYRIKHEFAPELLRVRGAEDLFDLELDPHELRNLAEDPANAARMQALRDGVLEWWSSTGGGDLDPPGDF